MTASPTPLDDTLPAPQPPQQAALGHVVSRGFAWGMAATVANKFIGLAATILYARLLLKDDFGQFYKATITLALVASVRDGALAPVLLARQKHLHRWENAGFWMSVLIGLASAVVLFVVGLRFYFTPGGKTVANLLWISAAASPLISASTVSVVKMQVKHRFGLMAKLGVPMLLVVTIASVVMAYFGCGAYSLMVPMVVVTAARTFILFALEPVKVRWRWERTKCLSLCIGGVMIAYAAFGWQVIGQGDTFAVSLRFDERGVGVYGYAFNLSIQVITVLLASLGAVLLPTLAKLNDEPARQVSAYLRMCRVLAAAAVPFCLMQAMFTRPIFRPLFGPEMAGAVPVMEVLSIGMAFAVVNSFAAYVFQSRQQFRALATWTTACITIFFVLAMSGVWLGGLVGVAMAVSIYHLGMGSLGMFLVSRPHGGWRDIGNVFAAPLAASLIAGVPMLSLPLLWPTGYFGYGSLPVVIPVVAAYGLLFVVIYGLLLRRWAPEQYGEIVARLGGVGRRLGLAG